MHSPDLWTDAWAAALPLWEAGARHSGWHPVLVAAADAAVALLCLAAGRAARQAGAAGPGWTVAAAALLLLALHTLFAIDQLFIELMRGVARASGWYGSRRTVQGVALLVVAVAAVLTGGRCRRWWALAGPASRVMLAGLALLAALTTLRAVSLHATDELISTRLAGLTLGRLIDALGLGLVSAGAWRAFRAARR